MNTCHACDTPTTSSTTAVLWHETSRDYTLTLEPLCTTCANWAMKQGIQVVNSVGVLLPSILEALST